MCVVSDKVKFCTCADVDDLEALNSYWILHQPVEGNEQIEIGMCVPPTAGIDPNFELNEGVILERLNDGEAFDKPFKFNKNDRLEVVIKLDNVTEPYSYNFKYSGRKWKAVAEDPIKLIWDFKQSKRGSISKERK